MASKKTTNIDTFQTDNAIVGTNEEHLRFAATMILVRDKSSGYEVFMIERPAKGDFPRLHVFPGGKVDPTDSEFTQYSPLLSDHEASRVLSINERGLRFWVSAIRECFEECSVLFARRDGELLTTATKTEIALLRAWAQRVSRSAKAFKVMLEEQNLTLATDELQYFSHWITPEPAPARFNTRFFIAKLPSGQLDHTQTSEAVSSCWVRPSDALLKYRTNDWRMILPTLTTLRMISHYSSADDVIKHVRAGYHKIPIQLGKQLQGMQPFQDQW